MPLTKLEAVAALVVIDLQKGIVGMPTVHPVGELIGWVARIVQAFRTRGLPVVLVHITAAAPGRTDATRPNLSSFPPGWSEFVPELEQQPTDYVVEKQRWGAFIGTTLHDDLRGSGVTQIFLTGVSTSAGVESTARSAHDYAYNVVRVVDAMTDRDAEAHRHAVEKVFPRLGETKTTYEVLKVLK